MILSTRSELKGKLCFSFAVGACSKRKHYMPNSRAIGVVLGLINKNDMLFVMEGIQDSTGFSSS